MLIQLCYERHFVTTTDLVERLDSFSLKTSNHHRGFESQKLVSLFLFVEEMCVSVLFSHEKFYVYDTC